MHCSSECKDKHLTVNVSKCLENRTKCTCSVYMLVSYCYSASWGHFFNQYLSSDSLQYVRLTDFEAEPEISCASYYCQYIYLAIHFVSLLIMYLMWLILHTDGKLTSQFIWFFVYTTKLPLMWIDYSCWFLLKSLLQ